MKRLFWACAGLSLGLHGALAIGWQPHTTPAATAWGLRQPALLHTRLIVRPAGVPSPAPQAIAPPVPRQPPGLQTAPGPGADTALSPVSPPAAVEPAGPAKTETETGTGAETGAGTPAKAEAEADTQTETAVIAAGWDHYLLRSQLTVVPSPRTHLLLGYPDDGPAVGRFVLTLTLYIDETGAVRRVDVASEQALPDALREAARTAFAGQRFSPGERAGEQVKSRIRIEVVYESLALPTFAANATTDGATP